MTTTGGSPCAGHRVWSLSHTYPIYISHQSQEECPIIISALELLKLSLYLFKSYLNSVIIPLLELLKLRV